MATGLNGFRLFNQSISTSVDLSCLVLDYDRCGFEIDLYHCRSGESYEVDVNGAMVFSNARTSAPKRATASSENSNSVTSALSSLLKLKYPGVHFFVSGSVLGVNNGRFLNRGWPRPVGDIKRIEVKE